MAVHVVVAEADPLTSEGLARSLGDGTVLACAVSPGPEVLERCGQRRPCVLLIAETVFERLDLRRFVEVAGFGRWVQTLVIGAAPDPCRALPYLRLGCTGYLSRRDSLLTVRQAVMAVAAGEMWTRRAVTAQLLRELIEEHASIPRLTSRQREILELIHAGYSNDQIAEMLYISGETLRWHLRRLFHSIGARDRAAAAELARKHYLLLPSERGDNGHRPAPVLVGKNNLA
jgi:DNA-binding NarL/FixJ family response regulator